MLNVFCLWVLFIALSNYMAKISFGKIGVITPVVSVLVSVFMLGLGLGSLCGGVYIGRLKRILGAQL